MKSLFFLFASTSFIMGRLLGLRFHLLPKRGGILSSSYPLSAICKRTRFFSRLSLVPRITVTPLGSKMTSQLALGCSFCSLSFFQEELIVQT